MSDEIAPPPDEPGAPPPASDGFGRPLAQAREALGLSVAEIAQRLRLHPRQVTALEEERLDALPEPAFVRGFLRNYAKEMKLDPAPLLAELARRQPLVEGGAALVGGPSAAVRRAGVERMSRLTVIGGAVLLLVVLGIVGWLASARLDPGPGSAPVAKPPAVAPAAPTAPATTPSAPDAGAPAATSAPQATAEPPAAPAADDRKVTPEPKAAEPAAAPPGSSTLRLSVGERPSWVEITQADGKVLLTGLLEARTERTLGPVRGPLRLVIGNASTVSLEYRGREVDLKPHVRANDLARLSLE